MRPLTYSSPSRAIQRAVGASYSVLFAIAVACSGAPQAPPQSNAPQATQQPVDHEILQRSRGTDPSSASGSAVRNLRTNVGFRSRQQFDEHFAKHGMEFGRVSQQEYLREAQILRDEPVGGAVEEIKRSDGTVSRYDRASGAFVAFNADGTIRTFFKPNNGEVYFRRQALRSH